MGSVISSLVNPPDEAPNENSRVIAIHSRSAWDEHWSTNQQNPIHLVIFVFFFFNKNLILICFILMTNLFLVSH